MIQHDDDHREGRIDPRVHIIMAMTVLVGVIGSGAISLLHRADGDELEHLHAAWLWHQGVPPYVGFFEHHPPVYWAALMPVVSTANNRLQEAVQMARAISVIAVAGACLAMLRFLRPLLGDAEARCAVLLFAAHCALLPHMTAARPDTVAICLLLAGSSLCVTSQARLGEHESLAIPRLVLSGALLGSSLCLTPKGIFWVVAILALGAVRILIDRDVPLRRHTVGIASIVVGIAVPGTILCCWVLVENDWRAFWFHNWTVNRQAEPVFRTMWGLKAAGANLMRSPMLSLPFAAIGLVMYLKKSESACRGDRAFVVCVLCAGIVLVLLGNCPGAQYHMQVYVMLAALNGICLGELLRRLKPAVQIIAVSAVLIVAIGAISVSVGSHVGRGGTELVRSLEPYQAVIDDARRGDTYQSWGNFGPVFLMDADPQKFMLMAVVGDGNSLDATLSTVLERKPRFIVPPKGVPAEDSRMREIVRRYEVREKDGVFWELRR